MLSLQDPHIAPWPPSFSRETFPFPYLFFLYPPTLLSSPLSSIWTSSPDPTATGSLLESAAPVLSNYAGPIQRGSPGLPPLHRGQRSPHKPSFPWGRIARSSPLSLAGDAALRRLHERHRGGPVPS